MAEGNERSGKSYGGGHKGLSLIHILKLPLMRELYFVVVTATAYTEKP